MKALIIEDEHLIAAEMKASLQTIAPDVEVLDVLPSIQAAREWFEVNSQPDLLFLDIKLNDGLSFELFEYVKITCPIIFCTAYEEYAIRAFKVNGVDYLLKPVQEEDLKNAITKIRTMNKVQSPALQEGLKALVEQFMMGNPAKPKYKERFIINSNNRITPIDVKEIAVIYKSNLNYFYKFNGDKFIYDYSTLEELEEQLDPDIFFRANRQYIININAIQSAKHLGNQKLSVLLVPPLKMEVEVSREKSPQLKKWLDR